MGIGERFAEAREEGAAAAEYGLLVAAIAAVILLVVFALGTWAQGTFSQTCTQVNAAGAATNSSNTHC